MLNRFRRMLKEKGQGLTEYVLILAFIAGLAFMMFGGNGSLKDTLVTTWTKTSSIIAGLFGGEKTYSDYFHDWRKFSSQELKDLNNADDRLKADQEALKLIAGLFLEKSINQVNEIINQYSSLYNPNPQNSPQWLKDNLSKNHLPVEGGENGWSDVLVPLSYKDKNFDTDKYLWLESNNNAALITKIAGNDAQAYVKDQDHNITLPDGTMLNDSKGKTISADRIFYSNGMIAQPNDSAVDRTVALKVHYTNGRVDQVQIAAQKGEGAAAKSNWTNSNNNVADLNLTVTGTSSNPVISSVNNPSD